jgi:hypothetical protein
MIGAYAIEVKVAIALQLLDITSLQITLFLLPKSPPLYPPAMIPVGYANSKSVDASNGRVAISKSAIAYSDLRRPEERLSTVPTLSMYQQDESGDAAFGPHTPLHQYDEKESKLVASDTCPCDIKKKKKEQCL